MFLKLLHPHNSIKNFGLACLFGFFLTPRWYFFTEKLLIKNYLNYKLNKSKRKESCYQHEAFVEILLGNSSPYH